MLSEKEKWLAVQHNDSNYDGQFFYGVKTTGIFCRPSCRSKSPRRENVAFFDRAADACAHGLRPCKRCRPDLLEYQPASELLHQAKAIFDHCFADPEKLTDETKRLPVSKNHLSRLFVQHFGATPSDYVNRLRVNKAAASLAADDTNVLHIAMSAGFGSLSSFYANFKKHYGMTPDEFRRKNKCKNAAIH